MLGRRSRRGEWMERSPTLVPRGGLNRHSWPPPPRKSNVVSWRDSPRLESWTVGRRTMCVWRMSPGWCRLCECVCVCWKNTSVRCHSGRVPSWRSPRPSGSLWATLALTHADTAARFLSFEVLLPNPRHWKTAKIQVSGSPREKKALSGWLSQSVIRPDLRWWSGPLILYQDVPDPLRRSALRSVRVLHLIDEEIDEEEDSPRDTVVQEYSVY